MILTIDAGNTRTKWAVFDVLGNLHATGLFLNSELNRTASPGAWTQCDRVIISNVAGSAVADALQTLLGPLNLPIRWLKAEAHSCGVVNNYQFPERLGTDRWASLIAAWHQHQTPCVVVNAGTALTVDGLVAQGDGLGVYLGGLIVPGLRLMQQSLVQATSDIKSTSGSVQYFPTTTGDAIYTGALCAMAGAVNSMLVKLELHTGLRPHCILSGGDASLLEDMLRRYQVENIRIVENLVLRGLQIIEKETGKGA